MNTETATRRIAVGGVQVSIVRKPIKNLHLGVYPPLGGVRVAAPLALSDDAVRLAVIDKLGWIKRRQANFVAQPRESQHEMVTGESHFFLGRRLRLNVIEHDGASTVVPRKTRLELRLRPHTGTQQRERALQRWYREQLNVIVPPLLEKWQTTLGVQANSYGIKRMRTEWGSCNVEARAIWLNLELAKKPPECIEYIVVHELAHLLERRHNDRFRALMDKTLPNWRLHRDLLNQAPLAHEAWTY